MAVQDAPASPSRWALRCGWLALAALAFTLLVVAYTGPAYQLGWISVRTAIFTLLRWAFYGAVACSLLGLVALVWNLRAGSRRMAGAALITLLVGAGLAANFVNWRLQGQSVPPIHDISTDTLDPPEFVAVLPLRADAPNPPEYAGPETAAQQRDAYPDLQPIRVAASPEATFEAALATVRRMRWELVDQAPAEGRIEATDRTAYFGFRDDVVIRIRSDEDGTTVVDVRSKSRVGRSDVGTNARRIREFRERLLGQLPAAS